MLAISLSTSRLPAAIPYLSPNSAIEKLLIRRSNIPSKPPPSTKLFRSSPVFSLFRPKGIVDRHIKVGCRDLGITDFDRRARTCDPAKGAAASYVSGGKGNRNQPDKTHGQEKAEFRREDSAEK